MTKNQRALGWAALVAAGLLAGCGGRQSVASKSAAAYQEAVRNGRPVTGGHEHGGHAAEPEGAAVDQHDAMAGMGHQPMQTTKDSAEAGDMSGSMPGMDHSKMSSKAMPSMDHAKMTAGSMPGMDHSKMQSGSMPGMDHSKMSSGSMPGMNHSTMQSGSMAGMDHSKTQSGSMSGMDHSKMSSGSMPGMDHSKMGSGSMAGMDHSKMGSGSTPGMDHSKMNSAAQPTTGMDHSTMGGSSMSGMGSMTHGAVQNGSATVSGTTPSQTLSVDAFDAPATTSLNEAAKASGTATQGGHDMGGMAPDATHASPVATPSPDTSASQVVYTCPMHPEVISAKPGKCPKCGMTLVRKK